MPISLNQNPTEFTTGVRQDVTDYSVMVEEFPSETVSASVACPNVNCSLLFLLSLPRSQSQVKSSVAAENLFGQGSNCIVQELQPGILLTIYSREVVCLTLCECFRFQK